VAVASSTPSRIEELEAELARARAALSATAEQLSNVSAQLSAVESERDKLRRAYQRLLEQMELLRRRIFVAKAERVDHRQLELEFEKTREQLEALAQKLQDADAETDPQAQPGSRPSDPSSSGKGPRNKPKGRRNLALLDIPEQRIELTDPELEGKAKRIGWEVSYKLGRQKPGPVKVVIARAKYQAPSEPSDGSGESAGSQSSPIVTAPLPRSLLRRSFLAPSMLAYLVVAKFRYGMPYFRLEQQLAADGIQLDRGSMARVIEDLGAVLGAIVLVCAEHARKNAFCLSTDATGVAIQPERLPGRGRQPCRKGHFFVVLADKDHVFFEYQPKHTSAAVCDMFRGFSGYVQADAHAVYDALFRGEATGDPADAPLEVGCWAHCRRRFWEAAVSGYSVGKQGLMRIRKLYELDESWKKLPPSQRKKKRQAVLAPLVDEFYGWVQTQYALVGTERGLVRKALGYAVRQEQALRRFLEDGRLRIDNTGAEREIKPVATGRRAWLFFGSDDHATAAANLLSLIASAKLHDLDPERYLLELVRVMPYWPRERYLDLAPFRWKLTRARLDPAELAREVGPVTVPPPLADPPEQAAPG
jgi:transposase